MLRPLFANCVPGTLGDRFGKLGDWQSMCWWACDAVSVTQVTHKAWPIMQHCDNRPSALAPVPDG